MRVFESLNCALCKKPFARVANQLRSPWSLGCGTTVCHECYEKEKVLAQNNKKKHLCSFAAYCFHTHYPPGIAYYLIDVLSQEDSLILAPKDRGYILAKPFNIPECPVCHDEYSNQIEGKRPSFLFCGHVICTECYLKLKRNNEITCPLCNDTRLLAVIPEENRLNDFLDELPEMTRQMEETRSCDDCQKRDYVDQMFHCPKCSSKSCGYCVYQKHQGHEAIPLLKVKVGEVSKELRNVVKTYKGLFPELHKELLEDIAAFETKLSFKEETLKNVSSTVLHEKRGKCTKLKKDFEATAEEYLPQLRKMDTKVKELNREFDKAFRKC